MMARSSGARPRKAQREQVLALRAKLGTITSDRWQAAQHVFDQIVELCGIPSARGKMVPRSCRACGYYGHSRAQCPERPHEGYDECTGYKVPTCREEADSDSQWQWICELQAVKDRYNRGVAMGLEGCVRWSGGRACDIDLSCECEGCREWRAYWRQDAASLLHKRQE